MYNFTFRIFFAFLALMVIKFPDIMIFLNHGSNRNIILNTFLVRSIFWLAGVGIFLIAVGGMIMAYIMDFIDRFRR